MTLIAGTRLGPYEILSALGAGGMGEVYKARDTRLDRTVAIKILPETLAADPQFRERFDREARAVSQLDHPHICALYDVGEQAGTAYLVMQYLEGETLQDCLAKGALPLDQALKTAIEIASALDKAHRAGIVHRDLKPGNIMLMKTGAKLLDFGLAKASVPLVAGAGLSMLPTTPPSLTAQGTILGTFQYMAPEQLEGHEADARTDIFAFGTVLYETLTGKKAFEGKSQASLIAAIMHVEPPTVSTLQPVTPQALEHIVSRCLAKEPEDRWQTASDLMRELRWVEQAGPATTEPLSAAVSPSRPVAWMAVAVLALVAAAAASWTALRRDPATLPVLRLDLSTPATSDPMSLAFSPDGKQLVFAGVGPDGVSRLWLRPLNQATAQPLAGTERGQYPFWSPDGRSIGFFADLQLKRLDLVGGRPVVLASAQVPRGGTWNHDGTIVFAPSSTTGLVRIAATGGSATNMALTVAGEQGRRFLFPEFLPDGRHFLFFVLSQPDIQGVYVGSVDSSETRRLLPSDAAATYSPTGHLLIMRQDVLLAVPFDARQLQVTGEPALVAQSVAIEQNNVFRGAFATTSQALLTYRTGGTSRRQLVWFDRSGSVRSPLQPPDENNLSLGDLSPDGSREAISRTVQGSSNIWLVDTKRGALTRVTFGRGVDAFAEWSPDGNRIVFRSNRNGVYDLFEKSIGGGDEQPILASQNGKTPSDWSPDGNFLLYQLGGPLGQRELWALPMTGERKPFPVVSTKFNADQGEFSPDSRWIVYQSNESGRTEIYLRPFPSGTPIQVTTTGGSQPHWRRDGREIFYIAPDDTLTVVAIRRVPDGVEVGITTPLFKTKLAQGATNRPSYEVSSDGQRFLMNIVADSAADVPLTIVQNWPEIIKK